jgi:hypothetical protein
MKSILGARRFLRRTSKDPLDLEITSNHDHDNPGMERGFSIKAKGQEIVGIRLEANGHIHLAVRMLRANPVSVVCCGTQTMPIVGTDPERKTVTVAGPDPADGSHTVHQRKASPRDASVGAGGFEGPRDAEEAQASATHARLSGWITEGQRVLDLLPRILAEQWGLAAKVEAAERKCQRLEEGVRLLRGENDYLRKQRTRLAETLRTLARELFVNSASGKLH